ncbi:hypothetical protein SAMN05443667_10892 [Flavobacterium gillisiae]|uniref:PEGA domain-containing protein n=1 Tax=Flavobacterium gillisiae TaxID=150146 RepID=A0A1H4DT89_9FLAO|nr:hypothetical protein [Flavobacterium gillisiae]SEA75630.1 hypothetical protein SAMN05443667_10892 [Flavobacterium gillisiae]
MKKRFTVIALSLSMLIFLNSCGVMFGGSRYEGTIVAKDHPNAQIYVDGQKMGNGQVTGLFPRNKALNVEMKEDGCDTKTQTFNNAFRTGNFILSVISWGLLGIGVDLGTGASYKPDHKNNPAIQKVSDKKYTFNVDYSDCNK